MLLNSTSTFPVPDMTIFLLLEPETSFSRVQNRGLPVERFETLDRLRSISQSYRHVIQYCEERGDTLVCLDATQSIEEIHEQICEEITNSSNQRPPTKI